MSHTGIWVFVQRLHSNLKSEDNFNNGDNLKNDDDLKK